MDEVNINKYLSQFNPILVVPVLSAVFGAIIVFMFGFKRPSEPRFQSTSIDSLKKSKRKANTIKTETVQTAKQQNSTAARSNAAKKADATAAVKKPAATTNNNTSSNNNNNIKKKTEEKKSDNGSPTKKVANKKGTKETVAAANKKSKSNKNIAEGREYQEKPADFDDGGWFTVQSKSTKQKNKVDESTPVENASPKITATKPNKSKTVKVEKPRPVTPEMAPVDNAVTEQPTVEVKKSEITVAAPQPPVVKEPVAKADEVVAPVVEKKAAAAVAAAPATDNTIVFDELGEWTDAKPDRKRGNKKKSRKD